MPAPKSNLIKFTYEPWNCHFTEKTEAMTTDGEEATRKLQMHILNTDIRNLFITQTLPEKIMSTKLTEIIKDYHILQVAKAVDLCQPTIPCSDEDEFAKNKIIGIHLVDSNGQKLLGVEQESLEDIRINQKTLLPGMKLLIGPNVHCKNGIFFLTPRNTKVLGGEVEDLLKQHHKFLTKEKKLLWNTSLKHPYKLPAGEDLPPKFEPFLKATSSKNDPSKDFPKATIGVFIEEEERKKLAEAGPSQQQMMKGAHMKGYGKQMMKGKDTIERFMAYGRDEKDRHLFANELERDPEDEYDEDEERRKQEAAAKQQHERAQMQGHQMQGQFQPSQSDLNNKGPQRQPGQPGQAPPQQQQPQQQPINPYGYAQQMGGFGQQQFVGKGKGGFQMPQQQQQGGMPNQNQPQQQPMQSQPPPSGMPPQSQPGAQPQQPGMPQSNMPNQQPPQMQGTSPERKGGFQQPGQQPGQFNQFNKGFERDDQSGDNSTKNEQQPQQNKGEFMGKPMQHMQQQQQDPRAYTGIPQHQQQINDERFRQFNAQQQQQQQYFQQQQRAQQQQAQQRQQQQGYFNQQQQQPQFNFPNQYPGGAPPQQQGPPQGQPQQPQQMFQQGFPNQQPPSQQFASVGMSSGFFSQQQPPQHQQQQQFAGKPGMPQQFQFGGQPPQFGQQPH